jgi:hypothetical protein
MKTLTVILGKKRVEMGVERVSVSSCKLTFFDPSLLNAKETKQYENLLKHKEITGFEYELSDFKNKHCCLELIFDAAENNPISTVLECVLEAKTLLQPFQDARDQMSLAIKKMESLK